LKAIGSTGFMVVVVADLVPAVVVLVVVAVLTLSFGGKIFVISIELLFFNDCPMSIKIFDWIASSLLYLN
jgi:hypothetical protein